MKGCCFFIADLSFASEVAPKGRKEYNKKSLSTISTKPDFHLAVVAFGTERKENYRSEAPETIFCLSEAS